MVLSKQMGIQLVYREVSFLEREVLILQTMGFCGHPFLGPFTRDDRMTHPWDVLEKGPAGAEFFLCSLDSLAPTFGIWMDCDQNVDAMSAMSAMLNKNARDFALPGAHGSEKHTDVIAVTVGPRPL